MPFPKSYLQDDGLPTQPVGPWSLKKYEILEYYATLFSNSMAGKWGTRVYVDLFSGPGRGKVRGSGKIIPTSPLISLGLPTLFDGYVFCEIDSANVSTLQTRVATGHSGLATHFVPGDCNTATSAILNAIPVGSRRSTVLSFCFVDPFRMGNLAFATIATLASRFVDFLVLIPAYMDARRNLKSYFQPGNVTVERFLDFPGWRAKWQSTASTVMNFGAFVADEFGMRMTTMGYIYSGLNDTVLIRLPKKNVALYRLAFFSRNPLGTKLWREAVKYSSPQLPLFAEREE